MNQEDPSEIDSAIFQVLLSLEGKESREAFLDRIFREDAAAKEEMRNLIDASRAASEFFCDASDSRTRIAREMVGESDETHEAAPPGAEVVGLDDDEPELQFGRYRVIRRLGEGGGGIVHEAEQEHPIRRRVAIKLLQHGNESKSIIARFEVERQALAMMDHPRIAKVLDAGTTESGRPYFVMELVRGEKITRYCDRNRLNLRERLNLFVEVCQAIQHAHQKGIIHRDIKPSNILVEHQEDGGHAPKVIDFGIAKATGSRSLGNQTVFTSHDQFFGTPVYASPEQLDMMSLDIDTRSDIYSLGALLYELLTSRVPVAVDQMESLSISRFHRAVLDTEILTPSQRLKAEGREELAGIASNRRLEPAQLVGAVRGDLDWIALKAMEKMRSRRYQTVNSLVMDIGRFLENQPVLARPPSRVYLLQKFVRRNSVAVGLSAMLVLLLLVALVLTSSLYRRADDSRALQLRLKNEAEAARKEEKRLRLQADARANVSRVAMLLDQGRIDEADSLRQRFPLSSIEPSLEAATVFRALGDWNAKEGRMDQALPCYRLLMQANRFDRPGQVLLGVDLLVIGAALVEGAPEEYLTYRKEVMETYIPPEGKVQAEHLLKFCLLGDAAPATLSKLRPVVEMLDDPRVPPHNAWDALALALYHYRSGEFETAIAMGQAGLSDPMIKRSCKASVAAVVAMATKESGRGKLAESEIGAAMEMIRSANGTDFIGDQPVGGCWWDWSIARSLVKEFHRIPRPPES